MVMLNGYEGNANLCEKAGLNILTGHISFVVCPGSMHPGVRFVVRCLPRGAERQSSRDEERLGVLQRQCPCPLGLDPAFLFVKILDFSRLLIFNPLKMAA